MAAGTYVFPPELETVRAYLKVPATVLSDAELQAMIDTACGDQLVRCRWWATDANGDPVVPAPADEYPAPLYLALLRRVQREVAARNLPLGMVGLDASEYGPTRLPTLDALVEEHERGWRRQVVG